MLFHTMTPNDVKIVADNIDDFIEVPNGIERLRKAVLTLAVSGKLVPQNKKEGTADELYAKIQARPPEKSEGRKKKASGTSPLTAGETLYEIPKSWKWLRLGEIVTVQTGTLDANASSPDGEYPFFTCADEPLRISRYAYDCECVLLAGNGNFNVKYYKGKFEAYQRTYIIEAIDKDVFVPYVYLLVQMQTDRFKSTSLGSAMPYIRLGYITEAVVSLPPFLEQKRIVQKVEELLRQLDELEAKKRERDEIRTRLARSAMQSLGKGDSKIAFEQLTELIKTPADLKELEGALLTLAVSGKLVPQDKGEGTADELYSQIQSEIGDGANVRKRKTKESALISDEELPFDIPKSWKWVRLTEIGKLDTGKTPRTGVAGNYVGDIPFIGPGDVQQGRINSYSKLITKQGAGESKYLHPGDVLMVCIGGTIGKTALVSGTHTFNQQINKITPCLVDSTFLFCVFRSGYFQRLVRGKASGGATPLVNLTRWSSCIVPLPPLSEQKRIVKKVEELASLVNKLREYIIK